MMSKGSSIRRRRNRLRKRQLQEGTTQPGTVNQQTTSDDKPLAGNSTGDQQNMTTPPCKRQATVQSPANNNNQDVMQWVAAHAQSPPPAPPRPPPPNDNNQNVMRWVAAHAQSPPPTPSRPPPPFRMNLEHVTLHNHVDASIVQQIARGEYVSFAKLPRVMREDYDEKLLTFVVEDGKFLVKPVTPTREITDFQIWLEAFRVFSALYLQHHPERSLELLQYQKTIQEADNIWEWSSVYEYDIEFRQMMAANPQCSWAQRQEQLYFTVFVLGGAQKRNAPTEICRYYNASGCHRDYCRFAHRCRKCDGPHPVSKCPSAAPSDSDFD